MRSRPWWVLLVLPLVPLWRAVFAGQAIGPWEHIRTFGPWRGDAPSQPWDVLQADGALQFYVWRDLVFEAWSKFQMPLWNPYQLAGTPLLANSQSGALYPPHILMGVLHVPTQWAVTLLAWFHLALAGVGTFHLARRLGATETGSLIAGASFGLSPFMVAWTGLASVPSTVAWIPWLLCIVWDIVDGKGWRSVALGAVVGGMMLLAGHLQFAAYGFIAATVLVLCRARTAGVPGLAKVAFALVGAAAIAAPQLGPVLAYSQFSHRRGSPTAEGYQAYANSAIRPFELGNLVNPVGLGNPRTAGADAKISSYWVPVVKPGANFAESALSPGAVALAFLCLIPLALRRLEPATGLVAVGVVGALLAMGSPLTQAMYFLIPGWSSTGSPGRAIVLFVLAASVLAGIGVSALTDPETRPSNPRKIQFAALGFAILTALTVGLGITGAKTPEGVDHEAFQALVGSASTGGVFATFIIAAVAIQPVLMGYFRGRGPGTIDLRWLGLAAVVAVGLVSGMDRWIMTGPLPERVKQQSGQPAERVAFLNAPWDLMVTPNANFPPNLAALNRIHDLAGYDSLMHRDTVGFLQEVNGQNPSPAANGNIMFVKPTATPEKLAEAGVTYVVEPNGNWIPVAGPGRASVGDRPASIVEETFSSVAIDATGPGRLIFRDRMMPGWSATVDGKPAEITGSLWREVDLEAGEHRVQFTYRAPAMAIGWFASLIAIVLCCVPIIVDRRERSPRAERLT